MKKEFIPYEQTLALKELGFDKPCFAFYQTEYNEDSPIMVDDDDQVKAFIAGYNKAKETLYTEEQVREAIKMARSQSGYASYEYNENEIIQSLKK